MHSTKKGGINKESEEIKKNKENIKSYKRTKKSRESLVKELGNPFTIHMDEKTKKRLRKICESFGHKGMCEKKTKTGRIFSKTLSNLVNYYFITEIIKTKLKKKNHSCI